MTRLIMLCLLWLTLPPLASPLAESGEPVPSAQLRGKPVKLAGGEVTVYWPSRLSRQQIDLLVHFHGAGEALRRRFAAGRFDAVLVVVNFKGLSSAYSKPFRSNKALFSRILQTAADQVRKQRGANDSPRWRRVYVSSFSAGYGAVREILKSPDSFKRINGLLAADSIYAGFRDASRRQVNEQQMKDFLRFGRLAANRQRTFIITHSYLETPYASTKETADYLLRSLNVERRAVKPRDSDSLRLVSRAAKGNFQVLGYEGRSGADHMRHLHHIDTWWKQLPLRTKSTSQPLEGHRQRSAVRGP